jgi:ribosomal protein S18 acetylase RimI-like enzyme
LHPKTLPYILSIHLPKRNNKHKKKTFKYVVIPKKKSMRVRKAKKSDVQGIYPVYLDYVLSEDINAKKIRGYSLYRKRKQQFSRLAKKDLIKAIHNKKGRCVVAEDNGAIVGYAYGELDKDGDTKKKADEPFKTPKTGWINIMAVKKDKRGKGIGTQLHNNLKQWFKKKKCTHIDLMVMHTNKAQKLYNKLGYHTTFMKMNKKI